MRIGTRKIGGNEPVLIIAELSGNHLHDLRLAKKTIRAIAKAKADAVKLQTYTPDTITLNCSNKYFQIKHGTLWDGQTLYQIYQKAYTPWEWQAELKEVAEQHGLIFFSSVFDNTSVDFLESLDVGAYKIASCEITDIPLIEYVASKKKPVIFSTGVATLSDIREAIAACHRKKNRQIAILKCSSTYPSPLEDINLRAMQTLAQTFKTVVGLSDHSLLMSIPVAAVALGAKIIEKHFILDRRLGGPDAAFSTTPDEFAAMVKGIREVEKALGEKKFRLTEEGQKARKFSRSLFAVQDIKAAETLTEKNVRSIRPADGLAPKYLKKILGRRAKRNIKKGMPLKWSAIDMNL